MKTKLLEITLRYLIKRFQIIKTFVFINLPGKEK